jgi:hypothetical protein
MATSPCSQCDAPDAGFRCGGCLVELYCRGACQKAHWRAHKPACLAGQALPFLSAEEVRRKALHIDALHRSAGFQPRAGPLRDVDLYEQGITLRPGSTPNYLAALMCGVLPLARVGALTSLEERNGVWVPIVKVGDPSVPGVVQMKCQNLGVDPPRGTLDAAKYAFYAAQKAGGTEPVSPVYYSSRWEAYMHC